MMISEIDRTAQLPARVKVAETRAGTGSCYQQFDKQVFDQELDATRILAEPRRVVMGLHRAVLSGSYFVLRTVSPSGTMQPGFEARLMKWVRSGNCIIEELPFGIGGEAPVQDDVPDYLETGRAAGTGAADEASELASHIRAARSAREFDDDAVREADEALADGLVLARRFGRYAAPMVSFSEEGVLSLEWKHDGYGVLIVAAGGGEPPPTPSRR